MNIEKVSIEELSEAEYNPRRPMTKEEYVALRKSIEENGYLEPIVANKRDGRLIVVSGHQRLKLFRDMKMESIDVSIVELNEEDEKELNIILNRVKGHWDAKKLANLVATIEKTSHLGLDKEAIQALMKVADKNIEKVFDKAAPLQELRPTCCCPKCGKQGPDQIFGGVM